MRIYDFPLIDIVFLNAKSLNLFWRIYVLFYFSDAILACSNYGSVSNATCFFVTTSEFEIQVLTYIHA